MPNFLADLGRGGPAITGALRDVTQTALTLEQMKSMNQERAVRENTLRAQEFEFKRAKDEEERKNRVIPFNLAIQTLRPEAKEGTELYKEAYNFAKGFGYIENVAGEEVIRGRNLESALLQFKGNEERFYTASLKDINNAITQLQAPTEKPLKPEEQQARQQQLESLNARKINVIDKLAGEEENKRKREREKIEQEAQIKANEEALKFGYAEASIRTKGEEERKLKDITNKKANKEKTFEAMEKERRKTYVSYKEAQDKGNMEKADALKDVYKAQTNDIIEAFPDKKVAELLKEEEAAISEDWISKLSNVGKQTWQALTTPKENILNEKSKKYSMPKK